MIDNLIILNWKSGLSAIAIAREYRRDYNKEAKRKGQKCITEREALAYVEPKIFEYETAGWKFAE